MMFKFTTATYGHNDEIRKSNPQLIDISKVFKVEYNDGYKTLHYQVGEVYSYQNVILTDEEADAIFLPKLKNFPEGVKV